MRRKKGKANRQRKFEWIIEDKWKALPTKHQRQCGRLLGQLLAAIVRAEAKVQEVTNDE
jgi:hypothetical protein